MPEQAVLTVISGLVRYIRIGEHMIEEGVLFRVCHQLVYDPSDYRLEDVGIHHGLTTRVADFGQISNERGGCVQ